MGCDSVEFSAASVFLVTGGAGFIGSNICEALLRRGHEVRCLDDLSTGKQENVDCFLNDPQYRFIKGDIRSLDACLQAMDGVDYVLHQAAWGSVPRSIEYPLLYEDVNIGGTVNVFEAAVRSGVRKVVYASSSSVYGDDVHLPKTEGREGRVLSPYALTKRVDEEYARLYSCLYGLEVLGLRYFNVFGRRQDPEGAYAAVIPKFIKQMLHGEAPVINGDGRQSRDFTYIENVVEANLKACAAATPCTQDVFNIAYGGREHLIDVYWTIAGELGVETPPIFGPERAGDIRDSHADISRAREYLGYDPSFSFADGIKLAIDWYVEHLAG